MFYAAFHERNRSETFQACHARERLSNHFELLIEELFLILLGDGRLTGEKPTLDQLEFTVSVAIVTDSEFKLPPFQKQVAVNPAIGVPATAFMKWTSQCPSFHG